MKSRKYRFHNQGGHELAGQLDWSGERPRAFALFAPCFTCLRSLKASHHMSAALVQRGWSVFRFDFSGLGESGGHFSDSNFSSNVGDLVAAARFMSDQGWQPELLLGHSLGGAAVIQAAPRIDSVRAVVTVAAPSSPSHVLRHLSRVRQEIEAVGEAEVELDGRIFRIRKQFLDDLLEQDPKGAIRNLGVPLLILHSPEDPVVNMEDAETLFAWARHPKSLVSLDSADHLLSKTEDARYVGNLIASWAERYLSPAVTDDPRSDDGWTEVRVGGEHYPVRAEARSHRWTLDEPLPAGGRDTGPTPYENLLSALGACTAITLRMVADRKTWPLRAVVVRLRHSRVHAQDCHDCEGGARRIARIEREISLLGEELSDEQRNRLLDIANRCPVHRTLTGEIDIRTWLKS